MYLSKRFSLDPLFQKTSKGVLKKMDWAIIPSQTPSTPFHSMIKEVESKLLKEAREKAIFIEKEAYEKGFSQGEKNGLELGRQRFDIIIQHFSHLLEEIKRKREELYQFYEEMLVRIVLVIAKRIIHQEISIHPEAIVDTLREAFQYTVDHHKIIVHLNPSDYNYLSSHSSLGRDFNGIELKENPKINRGGCYLETSFGDIDATIDGQFSEIESFIWEQIKKKYQ